MSSLRYTLIKSYSAFEQAQIQWPSLLDLHQQLRPAIQDLHAYMAMIKTIIEEGAQLLLVQDEQQQYAALALFRMHHNTYQGKLFFLDDLVVNEHTRASGVGSQVITHLETYARQQGCQYLSLDSGTFRTRAHKFYYMNNYIADCFHFAKKL